MGYPMTWRRVIGRNGLIEGGYTDPGRHKVNLNLDNPGLMNKDLPQEERVKKFQEHLGPDFAKLLKSNEQSWQALLGDLRRLEADVIDERGICQHIASRTGIDPDTVAAVLQEFMNF